MKTETMKSVLSDVKRHHLEADNERLREALRTIHGICEECSAPPYLGFDVRTIAKIARAALVSATPENAKLRHPHEHEHNEGEAPCQPSN
jgi:hypothetical protein